MKQPLLLLLLSLCALGCSQPPNPDGEIVLFPAAQVVELGATAQFGAIVTGRDDQRVTWEVIEDDSGDISPQGLYHAPTQLPSEPTIHIKVKTLDESLDAEGVVQLVPVGAAGVISLRISPVSLSLSLGEEQQAKAFGQLFSGEERDVTSLVAWSSTQTDVATVDAAGLVTGASQGQSELRATLGALIASASVEVDSSLSVLSIALSPDPTFVSPNESKSMQAIATLFDGSTVDVTDNASWSINNPLVASIGNTSGEKGKLTGASQGSAIVSASLGGIVGVAVAVCSQEVDHCDDNQDNDQDGLIDCNDSDCATDDECNNSEICQNEPGDLLDDDQDGLFDCNDPDCSGDPACSPGNQSVGAPCDVHTDCEASSDPVCLESAFGEVFSSGYCAQFCDLQAQDCIQGRCEDVGFSGGVGLCFSTCIIDGPNPAPQGTCRSNYQCTDFFSTGELLCYPQ